MPSGIHDGMLWLKICFVICCHATLQEVDLCSQTCMCTCTHIYTFRTILLTLANDKVKDKPFHNEINYMFNKNTDSIMTFDEITLSYLRGYYK